jgi:hypothetical protein
MRSLAKLVIDELKRRPAVYEFVRLNIYGRLRSARRKSVFGDVYSQNGWGDGSSRSGPGSTLAATQPLRDQLPAVLVDLGVTSLLDVPCGDLAWMSRVDLGGVRYIGADIVERIVKTNRAAFPMMGEFVCLDLLRDRLPAADAILCRDCLVHLSHRDALRAISAIAASSSRYLLCTTFPDTDVNADTVTPYWRRLNLEKEPFALPPPDRLLRDFDDHPDNHGKFLGVWSLERIRGRGAVRRGGPG